MINKELGIIVVSTCLCSLMLTSCGSIISGPSQEVEIRTMGQSNSKKLEESIKFNVISSRRQYENIYSGTKFAVHRSSSPVTVNVVESDCILPSTEYFKSTMNPVALLDIVFGSLLSTAFDSSIGGLWKYDDTLFVTPKVKDTPECKKWLAGQNFETNQNNLSDGEKDSHNSSIPSKDYEKEESEKNLTHEKKS